MNTTPNSSWFYAQNGARKGPVPFSTLQDLFQQGLSPSSLVWTEGMEQWIPASSIPELINSGPVSPYAPPVTDIVPADAQSGFDMNLPQLPVPLDIGFCFRQGWKCTLANFGQIFLFGLCYILISIVLTTVITVITTAIDDPAITETGGGAVTLLLNLVERIISIFLSLGAIRYGHRLLNGDNPPISELFSQGSKLVNAILASILFYLMLFVGLVLLIVPGIIVAIRFGFFLQAVVEKGLGPFDALKYSWKLTKKNGFSLFGFYLLGFLIVLVGLFAFFVGLLWAIPTTWLASLIAFRYLHNGPNSVKILP